MFPWGTNFEKPSLLFYIYNTLRWTWSGPGDFVVFNSFNSLFTSVNVKLSLFECSSYCIFSNKVSSLSFSIVNTLLKKSANISAFSPSSEAIILIPSRSVCSSDTPDFVFLLLLTYDQKCLLFDFAVSAIYFSRYFRSLITLLFARVLLTVSSNFRQSGNCIVTILEMVFLI